MSQLRLASLAVHNLGPIDLELAAHDCVALSGRSGSGKSLLLRAIADLEPHTGEVFLDGVACASVAPWQWRSQVCLLPAESQWWYPSVGEHFRQLDAGWLEQLGFEAEVLDWEVSRCSTGERQRLALLRLLSRRPLALLLDEPTANLDPESAARVEALIESYRRAEGAPVIWVSHDRAQGQRVATRHYVLSTGQLREASS
ncbi:MAG: ATP-binding protein [Gammaproteobacteria bacterium SG8_47]|nr:MAG: ATP-binding protein [Gammaproteobacteria bacterium SG8_47]